MEEKNKSKNVGGVAIIFVIGVLIIALISCILYIYRITDEMSSLNSMQQQTNVETAENIHTDNKQEHQDTKGITILGVGDSFEKITDAAKYILKNGETTTIDLDNDGIEENISVKYVTSETEESFSKLIIDNREIRIEHSYQIFESYVVDLNENDGNLNIILYIPEDSGFATYYEYNYNIDKLTNLSQIAQSNNCITESLEYGNLFIDGKSKLVCVNQIGIVFSPVVTKCYFEIDENNQIISKEVDFSNLKYNKLNIKSSYGYCYTFEKDVLKVCEKALENDITNQSLEKYGIYSFEENTLITVIGYSSKFSSVIEAKMEDGKNIYIFPINGFLVG